MEPVVQVALDLTDAEKALEIGREAVEGGVEWVEAGTPLIKSEGLDSVSRLEDEFPESTIVADMKTMDTGELEFSLAGEAGADVVSVLAVAADETIEGAVKSTEDYDLEVAADLIAVQDSAARAEELEELGVDFITVHAGIDQQEAGKDPLEELRAVVESVEIPVAVAGGLNSDTASEAVEAGASVIIVGSSITGADDPREASREIVSSVRG